MSIYKKRLDLHTHTDNSFDGNHSTMFLCEQAVLAGLRGIAFTDHVEIDAYEKDNYEKRAFQSYFEIVKARNAFLGKLLVFAGVELAQPTYDTETAEKLMNTLQYDFVIGSIHNLRGRQDFYFMDLTDTTDEEIRSMLTEYFEEELLLAQWGKTDTLAHLTYPLRYICGDYGHHVDIRDYSDIITKILKAVINSGISLEINTSGLRQKIASTLPNEEIIAQYRALGGELITVGSDAHFAEHLGLGLDEGLSMLQRCGFKKITFYQKREPIQIDIE
ncbi:MAG: histidinol-phosphatase HisJ family protein [Clostridia bacterium]|nr:histidinol-phosphatase HisJ family protein [Clostridia bacterium]